MTNPGKNDYDYFTIKISRGYIFNEENHIGQKVFDIFYYLHSSR